MDEKRRIMKSYFENALPYLKVFYQPIYDLIKKAKCCRSTFTV